MIDRLGPPPSTTRELRAWNAKLLAEVLHLSIRGLIGAELASNIRANCGALDRALPVDAPRDDSDDEDDDEGGDGPDLEPAEASASDGALRVG